MSRYTGARVKVMRALGIDLPGLSRKTMGDRPQPPGQHGAKKASGRKSEFGLQLMEKQKLRYNYGVTERQLRRVVSAAKKSRTATGAKIIELLERRLDNLVFRAGFAPTIPAARQLISHGHIVHRGRRVTVPSLCVRPGESFGPSASGSQIESLRSTRASPSLECAPWIAFDAVTGQARLTALPDADAAPFPLDLQRVVEYYATRS